MKNLVLIGMMGCGKSTVGKILAARLDKAFVDTDSLIEAREGISVPDIFAARGEDHFRALELGAARALSLRENLVISCGGGLPTRESAMAALKRTGTVVWLDRDPGEIYDTVDLSGRPLARDGRDRFLALAAERRPVYARWADVIPSDFASPASTAEQILREVF